MRRNNVIEMDDPLDAENLKIKDEIHVSIEESNGDENNNFNILAWNIIGACNSAVKRKIKDLISCHKPVRHKSS